MWKNNYQQKIWKKLIGNCYWENIRLRQTKLIAKYFSFSAVPSRLFGGVTPIRFSDSNMQVQFNWKIGKLDFRLRSPKSDNTIELT